MDHAAIARDQNSVFRSHIERRGGAWRQVLEMGNVKPQAEVWSEVFYAGSDMKGDAEAFITAYADNLPAPLKATAGMRFEPREITLMADELVRTADSGAGFKRPESYQPSNTTAGEGRGATDMKSRLSALE